MASFHFITISFKIWLKIQIRRTTKMSFTNTKILEILKKFSTILAQTTISFKTWGTNKLLVIQWSLKSLNLETSISIIAKRRTQTFCFHLRITIKLKEMFTKYLSLILMFKGWVLFVRQIKAKPFYFAKDLLKCSKLYLILKQSTWKHMMNN